MTGHRKPLANGTQKADNGKDEAGLSGVDHQGLVTERDIDAQFGLFVEETDRRNGE